MAPPPRTARDFANPSPEEYRDFIAKLSAYHEKRGTPFDPEPKAGSKHVNLLQLYKTVLEGGGYDHVSEKKLEWRKLAQDFNLGSSNIAAMGFSLKTVYYKYLAAYEISTVYGKEPPPREILEDTTARGAALLSRTVDNFQPRISNTAMGADQYESGDEGTPVREQNGNEDAPGSGGRVTRGLRQAPPQRILFQPDTQPSRHSTRHPSGTSQPHHVQYRGASTSHNPQSNLENQSYIVTNYEPRPQMPLTLRPVITPGYNAAEWARLQRAVAAANTGAKPQPPRIMLPGTGFDGPNIYVRCLCALKSGIAAEQDYALHHLVKISMERGDKYRFESFPGLAEALVEKVLEVCSLFYKVDWQIQYMMEDSSMPGTSIIDGLNGTSEILNKVTTLDKLVIDDNIQTAEFSDALLQIDEAALTLRNMVMLEENAAYVSELHPLRDFLSLALNLPNYDSVVELKHYALDIAEQLTKYLHLGETDPLYLSLLGQLDSDDRGAVLTALRAISRISMNLEENNLLKGVPATAVQKIMDWTLINDEEMVHACLDFLYQYTAVVDNVDFMVSQLPLDPLVNQLTRLLMHNAKIVEKEFAQGREYSTPAPENIAPLPQHALDLMLKLDETERSSMWLRCLFEEDPDEVITQIAFWQAYQTQFAPVQRETGRPLLQASDFIKNVSNTFVDKAQAQLQHLGPGNQRFVIKGLRYRSVPVDANGEEYIKCQWATDSKSGRPCGYFFHTPEEVYKHILLTHMGAEQREDGLFINTTERRYVCLWEKCRRFHDSPVSKLMDLARHIKTHLPPPHAKEAKDTNGTKDLNEYLGAPPAKRRKPSYRVAPKKQAFSYQITQTDERMEAAGIPLSAVLVLRNLARNLAVSKTEPETEKDISWVDKLFKPVEHQLVEVFAHNKSLKEYMTDLLGAIKDA